MTMEQATTPNGFFSKSVIQERTYLISSI